MKNGHFVFKDESSRDGINDTRIQDSENRR